MFFKKILNVSDRFVLTKASMVFFSSRREQNFMEKIIKIPRSTIIGPGVEISKEHIDIRMNKNRKIIAYIGRLVEWKGIDILIKAVAEIGIEPSRILAQSLITPSCGTGSLSLDLAKKVLKLTKEVSETIRTNNSM